MVAAKAITQGLNRKTTAVSNKNRITASKSSKKVASSEKATNPNQGLFRGDFRPGQEVNVSFEKLTLDQAKNDTSIKFLVPRVLPNGAKLQAIYRVPGDGYLRGQEIVQRYDINGEYFEVSSSPIAQAPNAYDFKKRAEQGSAQVSEYNADGTQKKNADGSVKMVKADNTTFITVNGLPGTANEPNQVKGSSLDVDTIRNPGRIDWYANGTMYAIHGDMPVSELLKIAESMQ